MKKWDPKKLLVSTIVFLFATMASASLIGAEVDSSSISNSVQITQEVIAQSVVQAPLVNVFPPKVAKMDNLGNDSVRATRIFIREIDESRNVSNALMGVTFDGLGEDLVNTNSSGYGSEEGAYVNMRISNSLTGMLNIDRIDPDVSSRIQALTDNPEEYGINATKLNTQIMPKIIEVATVNVNNEISNHQVLAMEPLTGGEMDRSAVRTMLNRSYSTFKAYTSMMENRGGGEPVEIHTDFWGEGHGVDAFTSTVIQMLAAEIAGVDTLTFHNADDGSSTINKAQEFLKAQEGKNLSEVLDSLMR